MSGRADAFERARRRWLRMRALVAWDLFRKGDRATAAYVVKHSLLPPLWRVLALLVVVGFEVLALWLLWRRFRSAPAADAEHVATAVFYTLSTVAQTIAALAGFLLAFIALRLPAVKEWIESGVRTRESFPHKEALARGLAEVMYVFPYAREETSIIHRAIWALGMSGLTIGASCIGLAAAPWLGTWQQAWLLLAVVGLALLTLDALIITLVPSLRTMLSESRKKARDVEPKSPNSDRPPENPNRTLATARPESPQSD